MKQKLFVHYDAEGDFLELRFGVPTPSYYEELGNDTFERRDEKTNKITGYALFNIQKRKLLKDLEIDLPTILSA